MPKVLRTKEEQNDEFGKLLSEDKLTTPNAGETVKGTVITASKAEVKLDVYGLKIGVVRGPELYDEADEYKDLKPGDEVEATVIDLENENGEIELSFRHAGEEKAWETLKDAFENKKSVRVRVVDANKGGLMVRFRQIAGFIPVSQLAPENYPRVSGGDKSKILEKLKTFVGRDFEVRPITMDEKEDKIIFSEKDVWSEKQRNIISKYKVGDVVEGKVVAVTDFGVFINFDESMEGLVHISELAWQRIDDPAELYKLGDKLKAEIINMDGSKIFLSAKKLLKDPWSEADKKYKIGQVINGEILKVNPFGLFVKLDEDIHGLAHISQLGLAPGQKIEELFKTGAKIELEVMSVEPREHRLGLRLVRQKSQAVAKEDKADDAAAKEEKPADKSPKKKAKEDKTEAKAKKTDDKAESAEAPAEPKKRGRKPKAS